MKQDCRGFQLIELTIATLLLAILAGLALSGFSALFEEHRLLSACRAFLSQASAARALAISRNRALQIRVHSGGRSFSLAPVSNAEPDFWLPLPAGIRFSSVPSKPVTFYSRGTATPAGTYRLTNGRSTLKVVVALSGRIRWERVQ